MKKLVLSCLVLLTTVLAAQAQTKIAPKLQDGFKAVYTEEATIDLGMGPVKMVSETEYVVSNVSPAGAVITATTTFVNSDAEGNPMADMLTAASKLLDGIAVNYNTNADGQVTGVANLDEVKAKASVTSKALIDKIYESTPGLADMVPREGMESQLAKALTAESIVAAATRGGVLGLNGKTIANGATEADENEDGMKMKRMYFVTGKNIIANSTLDMTKDEVKDYIIAKITEQAPEQAEMVKQNIDAFADQMAPQASIKTTYVMQDNGWPESVKSEATQTMMGQTQKQTTVVTLKR